MKKYLLIVSVIAFGLSFNTCGNKGENAKVNGGVNVTEDVLDVTETVDEGDVLVKFENLVEKFITLQEKVAAGDVASLEGSTNLLEEYGTIIAAIQEKVNEFTPEQLEKFNEIGKKWADAAQGITQP